MSASILLKAQKEANNEALRLRRYGCIWGPVARSSSNFIERMIAKLEYDVAFIDHLLRLYESGSQTHLGFVVKYITGEHTGKYWGKDEYGRWICSDSPFVFVDEKAADQAIAAPEGVEKKKLSVFLSD